jgi:DNA-binding response OmpR family regulator
MLSSVLRGYPHRALVMATPGKPADVFIVEDNDPDVFLVEEALRSQGIPALFQRCQDGEEAIRALSEIGPASLPDVIIIDLNLPKISGLDILKHVRSLKQLDRVPVAILTSSQSKTDRALSLQLGADAYIAKPPTLPEFLSGVGSGIRALIERSQQRSGARVHRHRPQPAPRGRRVVSSRSRMRAGRSRVV